MIKEKILPWIVFLGLFVIALSPWFFAIIIDYPLLIFTGYFMTYFIYRHLVKVKRLWRLRKIYCLLMVVSILSLWVGGVTPYLDKMDPSNIYFNLLSKQQLGYTTGNDFMWNGLTWNIIHQRIVPLELIPTYNKFWFNLFAALFWLGCPIVLGWACLRGYTHALLNTTWRKLWREWIKIFIYAGLSWAIMIGIARILVAIYS